MSTGERSFLHIGGADRIAFLQGILTSDITKLNDNKIQFAALLSPQGKILNDMMLIAVDDGIIIDTQSAYADLLVKRLVMYKLRAAVTIAVMGSIPTIGPLPDPRHPGLDHYRAQSARLAPVALGIPELGRDFLPDQVVALDAGYDLLNAVSFTKGCYVGQEVTARMHYKNIARRGFYVLESDLAASRLALLKFEDVEAAAGEIIVDNQTYRARLPEWMAPKFAQFIAAHEKQ